MLNNPRSRILSFIADHFGIHIYFSGMGMDASPKEKIHETWLGFDSDSPVEPGTTAKVTSRPQVPFRPAKLVIPSELSSRFKVEDFRVGSSSQFIDSTGMPGQLFSAELSGLSIKGDTAQISQDVSFFVTNISDEPLRFQAAVYGRAIVN